MCSGRSATGSRNGKSIQIRSLFIRLWPPYSPTLLDYSGEPCTGEECAAPLLSLRFSQLPSGKIDSGYEEVVRRRRNPAAFAVQSGGLQGVVVSDGLNRRVAVDRVSPLAVERFVKVKRRAHGCRLTQASIRVDVL